MITDNQKRELRARDEQMILSPQNWPCHPFLPIKRRPQKQGEAPEVGVLANQAENRFTVYLVNLFGLASGEESLKTCPQIKYETVSALLDDGWIVD